MADPQNSKPVWEARLREAAARVEAELREAVRTIDDEVVPEVRRHSSTALRTLAGKLQQLAEQMDSAQKPPASPPPDSPYPGPKDGTA